MIPLGDESKLLRRPIVTIGLLVAVAVVWLIVEGAGLDDELLATRVCTLGLVPGDLTRLAPMGSAVEMGPGLSCVVEHAASNILTPFTSMFLHASWPHVIGNSLFLWVFGKGVEDSMGRARFLAFYVVCGLAAALAQVVVDPTSGVPMVGASGAISGVMGAYLLFSPAVRVRMLFFFVVFARVVRVPAWLVLLYWFALQLLGAAAQVSHSGGGEGGVAVFAHGGGFVAGVSLAHVFARRDLVQMHRALTAETFAKRGSFA